MEAQDVRAKTGPINFNQLDNFTGLLIFAHRCDMTWLPYTPKACSKVKLTENTLRESGDTVMESDLTLNSFFAAGRRPEKARITCAFKKTTATP